MSDEPLFSADPAEPAATADPAQPAPTPALTIPAEAAEFIGEGKKYATVEAALASIPNAQNHISTIERENQEYKSALLTSDKLDQVLEKLSAPAPDPVVTAPASVNPEDVSTLVQQEIARTEKVNQERANRTAVESKLKELNGDKAKEMFNAKATEVGMTPSQLTALAEVSPQAVLALFNNNKGNSNPAHITDDVNLRTVGDIGDSPKKQNIMWGASTNEVIDEWRASAPNLED